MAISHQIAQFMEIWALHQQYASLIYASSSVQAVIQNETGSRASCSSYDEEEQRF